MGDLIYYFSRWDNSFSVSSSQRARRLSAFFMRVEKSPTNLPKNSRSMENARHFIQTFSRRENFWLRGHKAGFFRRKNPGENFYCFRKEGEKCRWSE